MRRNYVIGRTNGDKVLYLTLVVDNTYEFGYVTRALRFSREELHDFLIQNRPLYKLGVYMVKIGDGMMRAIQADRSLFDKFHQRDFVMELR